MDPNSNWKQVSIMMLLCGTWPTELIPSAKYRAFYKVVKIIPMVIYFLFVLSLSYGLYLVIVHGDLKDFPPSMTLYITNLIISIKAIICQFGGIQRMIKLNVEQDYFLSKTKDEALLKIRNDYILKAKLYMKPFIFYTPFSGMIFIGTYFLEYYVFWNEDKAKLMTATELNNYIKILLFLEFFTNSMQLAANSLALLDIDIDFKVAFGNEDGLLKQWETNCDRIVSFLMVDNHVKDKNVKELLQNLNNSSISENGRNAAIIWALHGYFVPTTKLIKKDIVTRKKILLSLL
ncbi:unnamed protein product [Brassicogethes aeneus]|uniref:Uncharacterized protein n=1 Tax=Brassicogethes aeneus TaxID=1431903 RepID=A0A9P0AV99_BRAAE|nr:unnamed protein product [Brassicogethes aeneus]